MIFRLLLYIVALIIIVIFAGLNWDSQTDVHYWFGENFVIKDVPVFLSIFCGFILGVLSVIPLYIKKYIRKKAKERKKFYDAFRKYDEEEEYTEIDSPSEE